MPKISCMFGVDGINPARETILLQILNQDRPMLFSLELAPTTAMASG